MDILTMAALGIVCLCGSFLLGRQIHTGTNWWSTLVYLLVPMLGFWSLTAAGLQSYARTGAGLAVQIGSVGGVVLGAALGFVFGLLHTWLIYKEARTGDEKMGGYLVGCVLVPIHIIIGVTVGPALFRIIN